MFLDEWRVRVDFLTRIALKITVLIKGIKFLPSNFLSGQLFKNHSSRQLLFSSNLTSRPKVKSKLNSIRSKIYIYIFRIENSITTFPCFSRCVHREERRETRRCNRITSLTAVGLSFGRIDNRGPVSFFERGREKLDCCVAQKESEESVAAARRMQNPSPIIPSV